eukprot:2603144-Rhodomonas_salina.1
MGNRMQEGKDYEDSLAPVPHATSGCIIISIAAAQDLELHSCDLAQAFIQADKLDEGVNWLIFIRPPQGAVEDADTVFEVCRPLYGIPSSARALHLTLSHWFKEEGFTTAGFEDSVWVREAGGKYVHQLIVSAHIDDTLMACESLYTLQAFKSEFLTRFEGTNEGEVTTYPALVVNSSVTGSTGASRSDKLWMCGRSFNFTEPGTSQLSRHHWNQGGITGHLSFVTMTRCDLALA